MLRRSLISRATALAATAIGILFPHRAAAAALPTPSRAPKPPTFGTKAWWRERELGKIAQIEQQAWRGWEASKEGGTADPDPRFLDIVQWTVEQRAKIYGLYPERPAA